MIIFKGIKFKNIEGIALWPFVLLKTKRPSFELLNHEKIHLKQQLELLILPFYVWYFIEWTIRFIKYKNGSMAYYNICFEREAYKNQHDKDYLKQRKPWSFFQYL